MSGMKNYLLEQQEEAYRFIEEKNIRPEEIIYEVPNGAIQIMEIAKNVIDNYIEKYSWEFVGCLDRFMGPDEIDEAYDDPYWRADFVNYALSKGHRDWGVVPLAKELSQVVINNFYQIDFEK